MRRWTCTAARLVAVVVLLAVVVLPAAAQAQQAAPPARGVGGVCPAPGATPEDEAPFPDLGTTHAIAILCAADYGLVSGFSDGTYRPDASITRGQMATFVAAWLRAATGIALPVPDEAPFEDAADSVHGPAIAALVDAGIVGGRADGTFGPSDPLTRGQFTRAVAGAISFADILAVGGPLPPPVSRPWFTDVAGTTHEATILALAGIGVASGVGDGRFLPDAPVTRGQLASFLLRAADYLDHYQRWEPTALGPVALMADLVPFGPRPEPDPAPDPAPDDGDGDEGGPTEPIDPEPSATVTLIVDAFNATLAYTVDVTGLDGPLDPGGSMTLHLGDPTIGGVEVLQLADGAALATATGGVATGVVFEADSTLRFADLLRDPGAAYVQVATAVRPSGEVRGTLRAAIS